GPAVLLAVRGGGRLRVPPWGVTGKGCRPPPGSPDLVEPADRRAEAGVAEGLELVVPGRAEGEVESLAHRAGVGELEGRPHAVLRDDDVAVHVSHGVEDAEVGGVRPPGAVGAVARVLGDLVAQVGPPAQGGRQLGARTLRSLPRVLGAV